MNQKITSELNETSYTRVRDLLRQDILSGLYESGVRLRIIDLSKKYGVSQMPVREALQYVRYQTCDRDEACYV